MDISNAYTPELKLDNSIITGTGYLGFFIKSEINNSYIKVDGRSEFRVESVMNNSYFKVMQNDDYYALSLEKGLTVHNSYVYLESPNYNVINIYSNSYLRVDDGIVITDKDKVEIHQQGSTFFYSNNEPSHSLMFSSKATITFKVKNGTWKDGTTDDIVITKNVWEKLTEEELDKILNNILDGTWDTIPNTEDYIKGDTVYTFNVSKVKGIDENPKTGLINYSLLIMLLLVISSYIYTKVYKKTYFK